MSDAVKFNVAIIGAGIGGSHLEGYCAWQNAYNVTMVCDLDLERAKGIVQDMPDCVITDDIEKVLTNPDIDIVDICLPPHLHFPIMMQALDAGKHVVCEKPFVSSLKETDQVIAKAKSVGKTVFPIFQYRYGIGIQRYKLLQNKGLLGKAYTASLETHWDRRDDYYAVDWRGTWAGENGGTIVSHATHIHDLICQMLGSVKKVSAILDVRVNPIETEDCAAISMQMESGALVTSSITMGNVGDMSRIRLCFEHVTIESGLAPYSIGAEDWTFTARDEAHQKLIDAELAKLTKVDNRFFGLMADIYGSLIGEPNAAPPRLSDARHSMELITAIYQAHRSNSSQSLPVDAQHPLYNGWQP